MFEVFGATGRPPVDEEGRHRLPAWSVTADRVDGPGEAGRRGSDEAG
ncbi:hypothetical protein [Amycolatopsis sp. lyj-23]